MTTDSFDDRARELAARDANTQYRPLTDTSEDVSGDGIVYADESEWTDEYDDEDGDDPFEGRSATYHGRFCGYPGMVWYATVRKVKGADLKVGDWLDTLDHRGARMIFGIFAGPAPADLDTPTVEHLRGLRPADVDSGLLTVMVGGGETETIRADVEYDVVDPDSQVTPDGTPVTDD